jgi:hypothetical protein
MIVFYLNTGQFITGGGWIGDNLSANGKANFGFNARYNKSNKAVGQLVFVWRAMYTGPCTIAGAAQTCTNVPADFVIKSNALSSLVFVSSQRATLEGRATIQVNRASDGIALSSEGGATFRATAYDTGTGSSAGPDSFSMTAYDRNGVVYHSVGEAPLGGGNLVIHASK